MSPSNTEIADQYSRRRAILALIATVAFLAIQLFGRPVFIEGAAATPRVTVQYWAVNVLALWLTLVTGGGIFNGRAIRALVNDEVADEHRRTAMSAGFWSAMVVALALYVIPNAQGFNTRESVYLIVTPATAIAMLTFSYREIRAHATD